jgi:hypothetical protein
MPPGSSPPRLRLALGALGLLLAAPLLAERPRSGSSSEDTFQPPPQLLLLRLRVDDNTGNGDRRLDYGERPHLYVTLFNVGGDAGILEATLLSDSPYVEVTQAETWFKPIPAWSSGRSQAPHLAVRVSEDAPDGAPARFSLYWRCAEGRGRVDLDAVIHRPELEVADLWILDGGGDSDKVLDPGETVSLQFRVRNRGSGPAEEVSAVLGAGTEPWFQVLQGTLELGAIPAGGEAPNPRPGFIVRALPGAPDGAELRLRISLLAPRGYESLSVIEETVSSSPFRRHYRWSLDEDPGWSGEGAWRYGRPYSICGNPYSGHGGLRVLGYNLQGCYEDNLPPRHLITSPIDCSALENVELRFLRWLGVEGRPYDEASLTVSRDGREWLLLWANGPSSLQDDSWTPVQLPLGGFADHEPAIRFRWTMGPTDESVHYSGWNIDEIELWGEHTLPLPTPTELPLTPTPPLEPSPSPTPP